MSALRESGAIGVGVRPPDHGIRERQCSADCLVTPYTQRIDSSEYVVGKPCSKTKALTARVQAAMMRQEERLRAVCPLSTRL
jgi:hypothetical protein